MSVEIPGLCVIIEDEPVYLCMQEEEGEPVESEILFSLVAIYGGNISFTIRGGGNEVVFTVGDSFLFKIIRFINDIKDGKESHVHLSATFLVMSLHAWAHCGDKIRFIIKRKSERAGEQQSQGVDIIIDSGSLVVLLRDFLQVLKNNDNFAHQYVCTDLLSSGEMEMACDLAGAIWEEGVAAGKFRKGDNDLREELELQYVRDTVKLPKEAKQYLDKVIAMLDSSVVPSEYENLSL